MRLYESSSSEFPEAIDALVRQRQEEMATVDADVRGIIDAVRTEGDRAVLRFTARFDGVAMSRDDLEVPPSQWKEARRRVPRKTLQLLERVAARIESFHRRQLPNPWFDTEEGVIRGQMVRPVTRAGVYVPGGKAFYPSSLLMNVIPAKVAGVRDIVVVTPPARGGTDPVLLAVAQMLGVSRVLCVGGAQAIAALAYGTETIPRVDVIAGPGNVFVAAAKRTLFGVVGIDMVAGPSEILVVSDGSVPARYVAADLLSQAEHDELAWCVLVTPSNEFARRVEEDLRAQMETLPRRTIAESCLERHGVIIVTRDMGEALDVANRMAPEHLELAVREPFEWVGRVESAGTVFMGAFTPEPVGDYLGGPNHVLPTGGTARFLSPLGVEHFLKRTNVLFFSSDALRRVEEDVTRLARLESLEAHARAVEVRAKERGTIWDDTRK